MKEFFAKQPEKNSILYDVEKKIWKKNELVCGIDEVGRGCLAGPIVTAAVILHPHVYHPQLQDSKLLKPIQLENIYEWIIQNSYYALGISNHRIIDKKNIYKATQMTMKKALFHLLQSVDQLPSIIVIDAMPLDLTTSLYHSISLESWIKGESKSASIAAASIIAKVTRDTILKKIDGSFPLYGFAQHKGYGTARHIKALQTHQASIIHRKTFIKNFQKALKNDHSEQQTLFC